MVQVPTYTRDVSLRPAFQSENTVRASPQAFGSDIGRGMQQAAQGLANVGEAFAQVQALEDETRTKEAENTYAAKLRERQYGENGYMTLSGKAAVDGRAAFERDAEEMKKEIAAGLTPSAARLFDRAAGARLQQTLQSSIIHAANGRKQWVAEASAARLDTFAEDAVAAFNDPKKIDFNIAAGQAEIRQQAQLQGWDKDTLANREKEYISQVRYNTALRMVSDDPVKARAYFDQHKDQFTGPHQFKFDEAIRVPLMNENVKRNTARFYEGGGAVSDGGGTGSPSAGADYYRAIRTAESGGNDSAKNPRSTATGRYQFIASTWSELARQRPDLSLTSDGRLDPAQQERAIKAFTENNAKTLSGSGIVVTNGSLYAAHFLGSFGAVRALRAPSTAMMRDVVSPGTVEANPFLANMTVGQFTAWAERKGGGAGAAPAPASGGYSTVEPFLATIKDPVEREMTRKSIYASMEARSKAQAEQQKAVQSKAFNLIETQNISPFSLPAEITTQIGMENMSQLMTYWEKKQSGKQSQSSPELMYQLQQEAAVNPDMFTQRNLLDNINNLSKEDFKALSEKQSSLLSGSRKAREEGKTVADAMTQAKVQLNSVGIGLDRGDETAKAESARLEAMFQNSLAAEIEAFRAREKREPIYQETQSIINRLLRPLVVKEPSWSVNPFSGFSGTSDTEGRMFQFRELGIGKTGDKTVELNVEYKDIPLDQRIQIEADLKAKNSGRAPSSDEVVTVYEKRLMVDDQYEQIPIKERVFIEYNLLAKNGRKSSKDEVLEMYQSYLKNRK